MGLITQIDLSLGASALDTRDCARNREVGQHCNQLKPQYPTLPYEVWRPLALGKRRYDVRIFTDAAPSYNLTARVVSLIPQICGVPNRLHDFSFLCLGR